MTKRREILILIVVGVVGLGGLAFLQFSRRSPLSQREERSLVQAGQQRTADDANAEAIQRIPGNLISVNEQPEAGKPFLFKMANFAQGATYELDLGDGHRKPFVDGVLQHTYPNPGPFKVVLYARFEGQEAAIDSLVKVVAQTVKKESVAPIIDY